MSEVEKRRKLGNVSYTIDFDIKGYFQVSMFEIMGVS